uniref:Uncharacterized protein n=1 Tax=Panagrolaimus davidi TaxID=227884 RepID=A0A914Q731_9BILA
MDEKEVEKTEKMLVLRDLLDQWALWGDTYPSEILSPQKRRTSARKSYKAMKESSAEHMVTELMSLDLVNLSAEEFKTQMSRIEKTVTDALKSCAFKNPVSERRIAAAELFCNEIFTNFTHLNKEYMLTQPANILMLAVCQIEKKKYTEAEKRLKSLTTDYPLYAPESKYYLTFLAVKKCYNLTEDKNEIYKQLADDLEEARNEFDYRMFSNFADRAIIEFYKESDNHNVFIADAFSQQQMELSQMSCLFIESVDAFLGGRLDAKTFYR